MKQNKKWESLTPELFERFGPMVKDYIDALEKGDFEDVNEFYLDFDNKGISPAQMKELVKEFGYTSTADDFNSHDYWLYMENLNRSGYARTLCICGYLLDFSMTLRSDVDPVD